MGASLSLISRACHRQRQRQPAPAAATGDDNVAAAVEAPPGHPPACACAGPSDALVASTDALIGRGAALLAASPSAKLWAHAVCGLPCDARALLAAGADPSARLPEGDYVAVAAAALRASAERGNEAATGAWFPQVLNRYAALHGAALASDGGALAALLAPAASDVDVRGEFDAWTPLHVAVSECQLAATRALLAAGADPRARSGGKTPLAHAQALPDTAPARGIVRALKSALAAATAAARPPPPPPLLSGCEMLSNLAITQLAHAGRISVKVTSSQPTPLAAGVNVEAMSGCRHCGKHRVGDDDDLLSLRASIKLNALLKCSGCDRSYYCSKACQRSDWARHKPECLAARAAPERPVIKFHLRDLGCEPSRAVMDAAVDEFLAKSARGLQGADNPVPSYLDARGQRLLL
jgi:hypothetical protein